MSSIDNIVIPNTVCILFVCPLHACVHWMSLCAQGHNVLFPCLVATWTAALAECFSGLLTVFTLFTQTMLSIIQINSIKLTMTVFHLATPSLGTTELSNLISVVMAAMLFLRLKILCHHFLNDKIIQPVSTCDDSTVKKQVFLEYCDVT